MNIYINQPPCIILIVTQANYLEEQYSSNSYYFKMLNIHVCYLCISILSIPYFVT